MEEQTVHHNQRWFTITCTEDTELGISVNMLKSRADIQFELDRLERANSKPMKFSKDSCEVMSLGRQKG